MQSIKKQQKQQRKKWEKYQELDDDGVLENKKR